MTRGEVLCAPKLKSGQAPCGGRVIGYSAYGYNRHGTIYCGHVHRSLARVEMCRRKMERPRTETDIWALWEKTFWKPGDLPYWREEVSPEAIEIALDRKVR